MRLISVICLMTLLLGACSAKPAPGATATPAALVPSTPLLPPGTATPAPNLTATSDWEQFQVTLEALKTPTATLRTPYPTRTASALPPTETLWPTPSAVPGTPAAVTDCRGSVDGMRVVAKSFTRDIHHPDGYFVVLKHLSIKPGDTLDLIFDENPDSTGDVLGPNPPQIYARPVNQKPYLSYEEFINAVGGPSYSYPSFSNLPHLDLLDPYYYYLNSVRVDNSSDGFLQFVILGILAEQFKDGLSSPYNDTIVLCNPFDIDLAVSEAKNFIEKSGLPALPDQVVQDAQKLSVEPLVELGKDTVTVRIVTFTKWGGFIETKYELERAFPHQLMGEWQQTLVPYDCGILSSNSKIGAKCFIPQLRGGFGNTTLPLHGWLIAKVSLCARVYINFPSTINHSNTIEEQTWQLSTVWE